MGPYTDGTSDVQEDKLFKPLPLAKLSWPATPGSRHGTRGGSELLPRRQDGDVREDGGRTGPLR